ncbi:MAG TPA: hypothetical protein VFI11_08195 [Anaerolineales bacterium]|nr:hypothetical protein [Anaerolineales bacterium]
MIAAGVLAAVGWLGLVVLMNATLPTIGPRWLFFFLLTMATTGTSLPFVWFLRQRFSGGVPPAVGVLLREGLWVGLFVSACAWLQINRGLTLTVALFLALGLVAIEMFLMRIERTTWRPGR